MLKLMRKRTIKISLSFKQLLICSTLNALLGKSDQKYVCSSLMNLSDFSRKKCNTLFQFVARIQPQIVLQSLVHGVFPSIISGM